MAVSACLISIMCVREIKGVRSPAKHGAREERTRANSFMRRATPAWPSTRVPLETLLLPFVTCACTHKLFRRAAQAGHLCSDSNVKRVVLDAESADTCCPGWDVRHKQKLHLHKQVTTKPSPGSGLWWNRAQRNGRHIPSQEA